MATDDTHTVTTPISSALLDTTARAAAIDPATAEVVGADVRDGELVVELAGEPV